MEVRSRMKLDYLPDDALYEILGHLNTKKDIEHVLVVNKKWFSVVHKLKFAWYLFEEDALQHENQAMCVLSRKQDFNLGTAIRGYSKEERDAFKHLEKAYKYFGLARNNAEKAKIAFYVHKHPLFPLLGSPEFKDSVFRLVNKLNQNTEFKSWAERETFEKITAVVLLLSIFFLLYQMTTNI